MEEPGEITGILLELEAQQQDASPKLFELLYNELRRMARRHLRNERSEHTLQPTALVNCAYLRLAGTRHSWRNRAHFFGIASSVMRRILVDYARAKRAARRPGSQQKVSLDEVDSLMSPQNCSEVLALDCALEKLGRFDTRKSRIVELRYFGGLTADETAEALGVSPITVQRDWAVAKAWLHGELAGRPATQ